MANYDSLMDRYQDKLQMAVTADERACNARDKGQIDESVRCFLEAASLYAEAAGLLVDAMEYCEPDEEEDFQKSIDRLIAISREMKQAAEQTPTIPAPSVKRTKPARARDDDDEHTQYLPIANVPDVHFSDIAGLDEAKQLVMDKIINPVLYSPLYQRFGIANRGGLLLYGPPGGGKTMLARAIAAESGFPFFSVRCSDIVGKYFGEAEKHVRDLFQAARDSHNAVVFLDEAEALACRRGGNSTVMARLVPELLSQMDGFDKFDGHIIVVFATNRPYDIDPAFLRPGRMAAMCYVPLPDEKIRLHLLRTQLEKRPCNPGIDVGKLARETERFSCADLVGLVDACAQYPINRAIAQQKSGGDGSQEVITQQDVEKARACRFPSVEQQEIKRLEKWTESIRGSQATA